MVTISYNKVIPMKFGSLVTACTQVMHKLLLQLKNLIFYTLQSKFENGTREILERSLSHTNISRWIVRCCWYSNL